MLRKIKLRGELGKRFGKVHKLAVDTPAEAIRALCVLRTGFRAFLEKSEKYGIRYRFLVKQHALSSDDADSFNMQHGRQTDFILVPVLQGRKGGGLFNIILGAALIGFAFWNPFGWSAVAASGFFGGVAQMPLLMGTALVLGGVSQMLAPTPKMEGPQESPENKPSYLFNGAVNTTQQGQPIPLLYGRLAVGSAVISASLTDKDIPIAADTKSMNNSDLSVLFPK
ncbi:hypothetical protein QV07_01630 [Gallibacterium genomosp. 3]|uniref:Tail protein n=2 Tax=Gallibacterium genomosp. 3 TaxID=505345 RepID=A0A1A7QD76_9PAST|nr:hypothetical protein QV07_01630 [Gallibacterium genomosp. 3]